MYDDGGCREVPNPIASAVLSVDPELQLNVLVDALRPLLAGIVGYRVVSDSGSPSLETAVSAYRRALSGPHGWTIGRLLCPTSQLETLVGALTASMRPGDRPWHIGAIVDEPLGSAAMHAAVFHQYMDPAGSVTSLEAVANNESSVIGLASAAAGISPAAIAFVRTKSLASEHIEQVAEVARIRIQPAGVAIYIADVDAVPNGLADAVVACVRLGVPIRLNAPMTATGIQWLLRLMTAAAIADRTASVEDIGAALTDEDPDSFIMTAVGLRWRDEFFGVPAIQKARKVIHTWSCDDPDEAISNLVARGLLPS